MDRDFKKRIIIEKKNLINLKFEVNKMGSIKIKIQKFLFNNKIITQKFYNYFKKASFLN